ncbi:MAG TPA: cytochrome c biogenesis protein ResB [Chloroflexota bacterium]|nr:cytochrome c biogenesis protein ResB [Chloroflexota bacterium]
MSVPELVVAAPRPGLRLDPFTRVWRLFCSVKFALAQILVLVLLTFVGTAISQVPPPMRSDPQLVERWVAAMHSRYGVFTDALYRAGVFDMFGSAPFRFVLGSLTVSVLVCTLNRAPAVWRATNTIPFQRRTSYYEKAEDHAFSGGVAATPAEAVARIAEAWRALGYRVVPDPTSSGAHVYADRYRLARLATFVSHLGLILMLGGGATTMLFGERNDGFVIPVGSTRALGLGTPYTVHLDAFTDEYYLQGGAKDYRSEVVVSEGDREIERATIRVNEPLVVGPVKIHQAYFGQAVVVEVKKNGQTIYQDSVPLAYQAMQYGFRPVGFFRLPTEGLNVDLVAAEDAADPAVRAGQVAIFGYTPGDDSNPVFGGVLTQRQPAHWKDLEFTFVRETQFSGFQAVRDPGAPIFFIAAGLILVGVLGVFYFPHRRLWALAQPSVEGGSDVWLAGVCPRNANFPAEFRAAVDAAAKALEV